MSDGTAERVHEFDKTGRKKFILACDNFALEASHGQPLMNRLTRGWDR